MMSEQDKNAVGKAIGALPKEEKERRTVRVDVATMAVYPPAGEGASRIGSILTYVERQGARTPTGGVFTSHRLTVRLRGDDRDWVGQISKEELNRKNGRKTVILRPLEGKTDDQT